MQCEEIWNMFVLYFKNELGGSIQKQVEEHLSNCSSCRSEFLFDKKLVATFSNNRDIPELSFQFNETVLQKAIELEKPVFKRMDMFLPGKPWLASIIGIIFSLFGLVIFPSWTSLNSLGNLVSYFLSFKPVIIAISFCVAVWILCVNESFFDKVFAHSIKRK